MELTWIEDFLALQRTQNFTEAAQQRCTTQPAFSRRVQQLEGWLGTVLFDRAARPIQLTPAGEDFLKRAQRLREDIMDARRIAMAGSSNYQQVVRIYTTPSIAMGVLPDWLRRTHPSGASILTSSVAGCLEALRQKRADKVLLPWFKDDTADAQLNYTKVADDVLQPMATAKVKAPLHYKGKKLSGALLMHTPGTVFGQKIAQAWQSQGVTWDAADVVCESTAVEGLLAFAKQGLGSAWLPASVIDGTLKRCEVPDKLDVPFSVMLVSRNAAE